MLIFHKEIHNILVEQSFASENMWMLFMSVQRVWRRTNSTPKSFNIYLSPVGVKSLDTFVINVQAAPN